MIDRILINGLVVTMNSGRDVIRRGGVAVDGGKIIAVGPNEEIEKYQARIVIDCEGQIILPGFVDAHGHAGHTFFRHVVKDTKHWMPAMTHTYKHYVTDEFWYVEGRLSALERLMNGVTTGVSVMGSQPRCDDPVFAQNNAKAYAELGIRNIVCAGPCHTPWPHNFSRWEDGKRIMKSITFDEAVHSLEMIISTLHNTNGGRTFAYVTPFGIITSINPSGATPRHRLTALTEHDKLQAREMLRVAKEHNTRIHSDCFGGMLTLAKEDLAHAVLGPNVHVQHCSGLYADEVKILADTGTHASVAPGSGAPVEAMLDAGILLAATTDGAKSGDGFDMFACMREFQRAYRAQSGNNALLPFERLLELVTIDAARVVGLDHMIGSLEPGKRADIITIDTRNPRLMPLFNPIHALVMSGQGGDVMNVMVDGELLMKNRAVQTADASAIYADAQREAEETIQRAGLSNFAYINETYWGENKKPATPELFDLAWQRKDGGHYQ